MPTVTGVSVLICCHNSAQRLPPTLAHLAAQGHTENIAWEIIVIDNASTDDTVSVARSVWPADGPAPLRVVAEPQAGLTFARLKGISEARYSILIFVDDDNWLGPGYISRTARIMEEHPEVAVCNGFCSAVPEDEPPSWFTDCHHYYAVSDPTWPCGDVTGTNHEPFGAGMAIRKAAVVRLQEQGFKPLLVGRQGKNIASGEDTEMCIALRLAGWRWWRDPDLRFQHYIPKGRMNWRYCLSLARAAGASCTMLDLYEFALTPGTSTLRGRLRESWFRDALWSILRILRQPRTLLRRLAGSGEGDRARLRLEAQFGRLQALIGVKPGRRAAVVAQLREAQWIVRDGPAGK
jgi:glycosyltransferase involved in cell wall biosynthesis